MINLTPPHLATFDRKPSWVNRAGRVDRSACLEVRASFVRRYTWLQWVHAPTCPTPRKTKREAFAEVAFDRHLLDIVIARTLPRRLDGDWRTDKANVMKTPYQQYYTPQRRAELMGKCSIDAYERLLEANPNRGCTRTKRTVAEPQPEVQDAAGFRAATNDPSREAEARGAGWSQTLRLERWRLHPRLAEHYLICPRCKHKAKMLFLPQATPDELRDALLARLWMATYHTHIIRHGAFHVREALERRYGLLFEPVLVCRQCLGLRYGEARSKRLPRHTARRAAVAFAATIDQTRQRDEECAQLRQRDRQLGELAWYAREFKRLNDQQEHYMKLKHILDLWDASCQARGDAARDAAMKELSDAARQAWEKRTPAQEIDFDLPGDCVRVACVELLVTDHSRRIQPPALLAHQQRQKATNLAFAAAAMGDG